MAHDIKLPWMQIMTQIAGNLRRLALVTPDAMVTVQIITTGGLPIRATMPACEQLESREAREEAEALDVEAYQMTPELRRVWHTMESNAARRLQQAANGQPDSVITVKFLLVGGIPIKYTKPRRENLEPGAGNVLAAMERARRASGM